MSVPRFWREIPERYNLQASRCGSCQAIHFPPREVCQTCRRASIGKMTAVRLSGRGTILEWTRVHKPAPGYTMQVPYVVALIQSPEGPIITGQVVDSEPESIRVGASVRSVFRRLGQDGEDGVIYYGTKWQVITTPGPAPAAPTPTKRSRDPAADKPAKAPKKGLLRRKAKG